MSETFRQCEHVQGCSHQVAWLPERGAKQGAEVELKDGTGFWRVISVDQVQITQEQAQSYGDAHRRQRGASDI